MSRSGFSLSHSNKRLDVRASEVFWIYFDEAFHRQNVVVVELSRECRTQSIGCVCTCTVKLSSCNDWLGWLDIMWRDRCTEKGSVGWLYVRVKSSTVLEMLPVCFCQQTISPFPEKSVISETRRLHVTSHWSNYSLIFSHKNPNPLQSGDLELSWWCCCSGRCRDGIEGFVCSPDVCGESLHEWSCGETQKQDRWVGESQLFCTKMWRSPHQGGSMNGGPISASVFWQAVFQPAVRRWWQVPWAECNDYQCV